MADSAVNTHRDLTVEKRVILLLATLILANPFILFLLTQSLLVATLIPLICVIAIQAAVAHRMPTLLRAYLFNFMAVVSTFLHAELLLVFAYPEYVVPSLYAIDDGYYFNRPFLEQRFRSSEYSVTYRTNSQGFRIGHGQDATHEVTTSDWLVIGDSFTQGAQVEFEDLFSTQLNMRFPDSIVVNAGISGIGIGHAYNYFLRKGQEYNPELVILQLGSFNDFMNVEPGSPGFTDHLMTYSALVRLLLTDLKFSSGGGDLPLGRWTEPFYPDDRSNADYNIFYKKSSPTKERDLQNFKRYLHLFKQAIDRRGARLLVVLVPTREQVRSRYLEEVLNGFSIDVSAVNMLRPNELLKELTQQLDIAFLDLLPAFQGAVGSLFFDYDEHLTALGHGVMANAIGDYLDRTQGPSTVRLLSRELAGDRYPMLSQDGSLISYQSFRDGNMELFVGNAQMTERRRLTFNDVDESHPMLSVDNARLLFTEGSAPSLQTDVVVMNTDGSQRTVLTADPHVFGAIATFSPSNLRVAYAEWRYDEGSRQYSNPQIVVLDLFSGMKTLVTSDDRESWRPVFSPDETKLAYIVKSGRQFDLYLYDLATGTERPLTHTTFDEWDPQFAPDGGHLVYAARRDGNWDLFIHDLATGQDRRLTKTRGDEWDPSVAPDGSLVLFAGRFGLLEALFQMTLPQ